VLSLPGVQEREPGQENNKALMWRLLKLSRPDLPYLMSAFFFLVMAVLGEWGEDKVRWRWEKGLGTDTFMLSFTLLSGETLIPHYSGRVIDILGGAFDPDAFSSAIFFMCLFSIGR
jgi:ATP-binding cassette subfamily B (MDR/TAP) protein 3